MFIEIRPPRPEDAEGVQELLYRSWLATYPNVEYGVTVEDVKAFFAKRSGPEFLAERRKAYRNPNPLQPMAVAEDIVGNLVGMCRLTLRENLNQLQALYVHPDHFGKKIGFRLWSDGQKFMDPDSRTIVHLATYNCRAAHFYRRLGFVDTGSRFTEDRFVFPSGARIPEMEMELLN